LRCIKLPSRVGQIDRCSASDGSGTAVPAAVDRLALRSPAPAAEPPPCRSARLSRTNISAFGFLRIRRRAPNFCVRKARLLNCALAAPPLRLSEPAQHLRTTALSRESAFGQSPSGGGAVGSSGCPPALERLGPRRAAPLARPGRGAREPLGCLRAAARRVGASRKERRSDNLTNERREPRMRPAQRQRATQTARASTGQPSKSTAMSGWHSLSGLLYSKPTGAFSRFKSKRPQYYVFEESKCQLHFYKDKHEAAQKDKEPLGTINVRGASITLHFEEPNSFVINSDSKEFILQAENHESMMIWLLALQANRDAFASRELKPENSRMSKQLALAHKRRESAPGPFNGSSSLGSIPGRVPAGGAAAGGRRMPRMSTLDQTSSMMTRSAIEEEDEITKDWVDCEFLPEVAGAVGLPSSPPSPEPLTGKCAAAVKSFFVNTVEAAMNY
uniref:PH domain-containing protein n=1 Tax=Macrostomum lignano TaxID=282301 RepID=A0A1I8IHC2_9PLAT